MSIYHLKVAKRDSKEGSGGRLRIKGEVPAIYYRKNGPSIPLKIGARDIEALLKSPMGLIKLDMDNNESFLVVAKEIQREPVSHRPIHMSFEGVKEGEMFHISLPVKLEFKENCEWQKAKGMAILKMAHLNIEVLPTKMPDAIHIDINKMEIGDMLDVGSLKAMLPDFKFLDNPHTEVVSVVHKVIIEEPAPEKEKTAAPGIANITPGPVTKEGGKEGNKDAQKDGHKDGHKDNHKEKKA